MSNDRSNPSRPLKQMQCAEAWTHSLSLRLQAQLHLVQDRCCDIMGIKVNVSLDRVRRGARIKFVVGVRNAGSN